MNAIARRIGMGFAARGEVEDVVAWSAAARRAGLDSVWIHDSYFERDAVTYASAIASQLGADETEDGFRIALGALNPYTRHPVVLAMTGSALDEMAPGRIVMGLGTGLPLRLKQMGIGYAPDQAVERVSGAIDTLRALWAGERLASATEGLPPIQPMFAPPHRIPLVIAAYRREFVELAGRKADGYLARPAESLQSLTGILRRLRVAAEAAGRDPAAIESAGYLLTLVDKSRRDALNRAKREPFVIYMMSVLGDVSMARAGFERELRDRIAAAWRAEDFHEAASLIPDELLDAFMLCGTAEQVAEGALAFHLRAGLELPLLQPVLQEESQVGELIQAAAIYGRLGEAAAERWGLPVEREGDGAAIEGGPIVSTLPDALTPLERSARRVGTAWEVIRPFSFTASIIPVAAGGALAFADGLFNLPLFLLAMLGGVLLHIGTNVTNEIYDVRKGIDTITSPRASHAILKGRIRERQANAFALVAFAAAALVGVALIAARGWPIAALGVAGLAGGYFYTAPPFEYKFRALGLPLVFLLMGPLMTVGSYFAVSGAWSPVALVLSLPIGLLVAAILHGNEWRDIREDTRAGIVTLSSRIGREWAHYGYLALTLGAYMVLGLAVVARALPPATLLAILSLPLLVVVVRSAELGASGQARAIAMIDLQTARLHAAFGLLLVAGVILAALVR
ncbi:MAG TPA: LLM class flavin-dependent oxidoreductase [Candidatus Limnocylindria bacterium]|jgi:1,4-dihydroxy-2-naphthoate octaprenyltransferase|nr:LLM class flavin-dependent oxidoreductase [Candidatus Limnocylindria bacterium]